MKVYHGKYCDAGPCEVFVSDASSTRRLPERQDLRNHSPDGLQWGYSGSGPSQLALAILADFTGDDVLALRHHTLFKEATIAPIRGDLFIKAEEISAFLEALWEAEQA